MRLHAGCLVEACYADFAGGGVSCEGELTAWGLLILKCETLVGGAVLASALAISGSGYVAGCVTGSGSGYGSGSGNGSVVVVLLVRPGFNRRGESAMMLTVKVMVVKVMIRRMR